MAVAKQQQPKTELVKASPIYGLASKYNIEPDKFLATLRGTILKPDKSGKPASNEEAAAFCIVAEQYNLNPFAREIHAFVGRGGGVVPIVGIDGWVKIVNSQPTFDGCVFTEQVDEKGGPFSITCTMHVKGRSHPVVVTEYFAECVRSTDPWKGMPWRMLRHKAYMQAARYAFGLSGIFDEDEGLDVISNQADGKAPVKWPQAITEQSEVADDGEIINQDADDMPEAAKTDPAFNA